MADGKQLSLSTLNVLIRYYILFLFLFFFIGVFVLVGLMTFTPMTLLSSFIVARSGYNFIWDRSNLIKKIV